MRIFKAFEEKARVFLSREVPGSIFYGILTEEEKVIITYTRTNDTPIEKLEWKEGPGIWEGVFRLIKSLDRAKELVGQE